MILFLLALGCGQPPQAPPTDRVTPADAALPAEWGRGCAPTNESACVRWGEQARQIPKEYQGFLRPSCDRGHGPACVMLAEYLTEDGLATKEEVAPLYERGCEMGYGSACLLWSKSLQGDQKQQVLEKGCALQCVWCCKGAGLPLPTW